MLLSPATFRRKVSRCFNHFDTSGVALLQLAMTRLNGAPKGEDALCSFPKRMTFSQSGFIVLCLVCLLGTPGPRDAQRGFLTEQEER